MNIKLSITELKYKCIRCKHRWIIRQPRVPRVCPRCKLPWDRKGRGLGWRKGLYGTVKELKREARRKGVTNLSELARIKEGTKYKRKKHKS